MRIDVQEAETRFQPSCSSDTPIADDFPDNLHDHYQVMAGNLLSAVFGEFVLRNKLESTNVTQIVNFSVDKSGACAVSIYPSCYLRYLICADASRTPLNQTAFSVI
jgi:hypothetical protein